MSLHRFFSFSIVICFSLFVLSVEQGLAGCPENILKRAERGDCNAQSYIGHLFLSGKGVEQNFEKARYWYQRVIDQEGADAKIIAHANLIMGLLYSTGRGGRQCYQTAAQCFRKAAEQGYTDAHINIGLMYAKGLGVKQDYRMALHWWRLAEEKKHPTAAGYVKELKKKMALQG